MHLGSLLIGIALGSILTLAATRLRRRPPLPRPVVAAAPAEPPTPRVVERPRPVDPPRPPVAPLTLDRPPDEDRLHELLERNRRLDRDAAERLRR